MAEVYYLDEDCVIDAFMSQKLIAELGFPVIREHVIIALRDVQRGQLTASHAHVIDNEVVYLSVIGNGSCQGRRHPALMLPYTVVGNVIEPLTMFKASEVLSGAESVDSDPLAPISFGQPPLGRERADAPQPEPLERRLTRELRAARRRRTH